MANAFSREEKVAFDRMLEGFQDALVLSRAVTRLSIDSVTAARTGDIVWRPMPYIANSFDGMDQTSNFSRDLVQLSVPATLGYSKSVPWTMDAKELRDSLQEDRLGKAARQKLASDINVAVASVAALQGTLVVKRLNADSAGFDDLAACDALMNESGISMMDRHIALSSRDYNAMASNLANRQTLQGKPVAAWEEAVVGRNVAGFTVYKADYMPRLSAATATSVVINEATAANRRWVPKATSTAGTGEVSNVDNRRMQLSVTVGTGTVKVGDCFTIAGLNAVHPITKQDTGQLKTFRVTGIVSGGGATGVIEISPPIIPADGTTDAEKAYANVTTTPANSAALTFLNAVTAYANPFWHESAIELIPGRYALPDPASGVSVLRATTDQGVELALLKWFDVKTLKTLFRADVFFGVCMVNPQMAGILLRQQGS